ncbi:MAG: hypothetical protein WAU91_01965 [Desulfatitalea sp.]
MVHWLGSILENLTVMVSTIVVFVGSLYLLLLMLNAWLRFKTGSRETEGLSNLWQETQAQLRSEKKKNDSKQSP